MNWVVTPSKLCNLRCSYCYEWNELGDPRRMSEELLRGVFVAVRDYHKILREKYGRATSTITWLGGEPLILPVEYRETLMRVEREVLGDLLATGEFFNIVQTNLYQVPEHVLSFVQRHEWRMGISFDVIPGTRVTLTGKETELRVTENIARCKARGIELEAIAVLAKHTAPRIIDVYERFVQLGFKRVRVLPLFSGPPERPAEHILTSNKDMVDALCKLFVHWVESGTRVQIEPLEEYLRNLLLARKGIASELYDRRKHDEGVLIINTDGRIYHLLDAYIPELALGHIGVHNMREVLESPARERSLKRDAELSARMCAGCEFARVCNGTPALESPRDDHDADGRCAVAHRVYRFIDDYLRRLDAIGQQACGSSQRAQ